jgi:hypothetical protein
MPKTVLKTFRLPIDVAKEIETGAKKNNVSQAQYVVTVVTENKFLKLKKSFDEDAKRMESDILYKKEQIDLAEADFL